MLAYDVQYCMIFIMFGTIVLQEVLQRHPLHTVAQVVQYMDGYSKNNIIFKIGRVGRSVYDCYLFQCTSLVEYIFYLIILFIIFQSTCILEGYYSMISKVYPWNIVLTLSFGFLR